MTLFRVLMLRVGHDSKTKCVCVCTHGCMRTCVSVYILHVCVYIGISRLSVPLHCIKPSKNWFPNTGKHIEGSDEKVTAGLAEVTHQLSFLAYVVLHYQHSLWLH